MRLRLALTALTTALSAGGSSAFAPPAAASAGRRLAAAGGVRMPMPASAARRSYAATATSLQMANVLRLSNPMEEMLNDVDVFIFDCDGVIWRVSRVEVSSLLLSSYEYYAHVYERNVSTRVGVVLICLISLCSQLA